MPKVTVPALRTFSHGGRTYVVGEAVTVEPVEASILARQGLVSLTRRYRTASMDVSDAPAVRTKRRYRRRDMTADAE